MSKRQDYWTLIDQTDPGQLPSAAGQAAYASGYSTGSSVVFRMAKPLSYRDTFSFTSSGMEMMAMDLILVMFVFMKI